MQPETRDAARSPGRRLLHAMRSHKTATEKQPAISASAVPCAAAPLSFRTPHIPTLEQFQFEMLRISNHTDCRFTENARCSAHVGPGDAVPLLAFFLFKSDSTKQ